VDQVFSARFGARAAGDHLVEPPYGLISAGSSSRSLVARQLVPLARRGEGCDRILAPALQRDSPSFEPGLFDAPGVHRQAQCASRNVRAGNGPGRCATWGLRAPARCITVPRGATEASRRGARLKLTVVRRNRAGHVRSNARKGRNNIGGDRRPIIGLDILEQVKADRGGAQKRAIMNSL
jgi:hypothetical protein